MKNLFVLLSVLATGAQADCAEQVVDTQLRIQAMASGLDDAERIELTSMLLALCDTRKRVDSVIRTPEGKVISTQGLNPKSSDAREQDFPVFIGIDVEADQRDLQPPRTPISTE